MPENAAAEGGYGLSEGQAFGGGVIGGGASGNSPGLSPGAVGGHAGGLGSVDGRGPAAQSGVYGMGTPNAAANAAMAQAIADRASAIASSNVAARGVASKAAGTLGVGNVAAAQGLVANTIDAFGSITDRGIASIAAETGVPESAVAAMANTAMSGQMAPSVAASIADNMATSGQFANQSAQLGLFSAGINTGLFGTPTAPAQSGLPSIGRSAPAMGTTPGLPGLSTTSAPATSTRGVGGTQSQPSAPANQTFSNTAPSISNSRPVAPTNYSQKGLLGRIAQDISMGLTNPFASREQQTQSLLGRGYSQAEIDSYFDRTDATMARDQEMQGNAPGARDEVVLEEEDSTLGPRVNNPAMQYRRMLAERFGGMAPQGMAQQAPTGFGGKGGANALTVFQPPEVTPEMRREALRIFESQRGAGQIPYQMLPYQQVSGSMSQQNVSPAFQYAAQNYQRLGGSQRLMDRPMEMMSVAERQRINEMAQGMADAQSPTALSGKGAPIAASGAVSPALLASLFGSGIGSLYGSGRVMF